MNDSLGVGIGRSRNISEIPFVVSLNNGTNHFCGAVLLSNEWAITCAHCVDPSNIKKFQMRIASTFRTHGGFLINILNIIPHPSYKEKLLDNHYDIALLKLEKFNSLIISQYAMLPECNNPEPCEKGDTIEISGWGENNVTDPVARTKLQSSVLSLTGHDACNRKLGGFGAVELHDSDGWYITESMFCAGHKKGGKDACQGDSGGPVICKKSGHLIGIITAGDGCAEANKPGIYTSVSNYKINSWIHQTTHTEFACGTQDFTTNDEKGAIFKNSFKL